MKKNQKRLLRSLVVGSLIAALLLLAFLFLDWTNLPSLSFSLMDRAVGQDLFVPLFQWVRSFSDRWGELATFCLGYMIAVLLPTRTEKQTDQILDYIRANLIGFPSVYSEVCSLLEWLKDDEESCFIMVSQSPLLGADLAGEEAKRFANLLGGRREKRNRLVCLSPYSSEREDLRRHDVFNIRSHESDLAEFYKALARYDPTRKGGREPHEQPISAERMFGKAKTLLEALAIAENTDVLLSNSVPYQVFIGSRSDGERRCVLLLSGWDAIKKNLPSGGFRSSDPTFLSLVEDSIKVIFGKDDELAFTRHRHTKKIVGEIIDSWEEFKNSEPDDIPEDRLRSVRIAEIDLALYPWVFDPSTSESASVMAKAVTDAVRSLKKIKGSSRITVWDIGCGSGLLSILAASADNGVDVVGVDINPFAVACSTENARRHNDQIQSKDSTVQFIHNENPSPIDLLSPFESSADLIVADLPFVNAHPFRENRNHLLLQSAYYDFDLSLNREILLQARNRLTERGRLVISYSDLESVDEHKKWIRESGWDLDEKHSVHKQRMNKHDWYAYSLSL